MELLRQLSLLSIFHTRSWVRIGGGWWWLTHRCAKGLMGFRMTKTSLQQWPCSASAGCSCAHFFGGGLCVFELAPTLCTLSFWVINRVSTPPNKTTKWRKSNTSESIWVRIKRTVVATSVQKGLNVPLNSLSRHSITNHALTQYQYGFC